MKIPYYSQHDDVREQEWKDRSCAIVCVKMVLEYCRPETRSLGIDALIREGVEIGGLNENKDWLHEKLVQLLRNHGVVSYRQEFKTLNKDFEEDFLRDGIFKLEEVLDKKKPVMVSVPKRFEEGNSFHMIVLTGTKKSLLGTVEGFYYNDSDYRNNEGENLFVDIDVFRRLWRRMAVFVE